MFHLIRKYSNRKLYDIATRSFIRQEDIISLLLEGEEIRIEDNDTHIDITNLEIQKALSRFPELRSLYLNKARREDPPFPTETGIDTFPKDDSSAYVPAEIRLLDKSLEYLSGALHILTVEPVYNAPLHSDIVQTFLAIEKRLRKLKKKHKLE